jgi:hypothetical protein
MCNAQMFGYSANSSSKRVCLTTSRVRSDWSDRISFNTNDFTGSALIPGIKESLNEGKKYQPAYEVGVHITRGETCSYPLVLFSSIFHSMTG